MKKQYQSALALVWKFNYEFKNEQHSRTKNVVYKIENTISGKVYVGQTRRCLYQRWANYKHDLLRPIQIHKRAGSNVKLKRSVQKYYRQLGHVDFLNFSILDVVEVHGLSEDELRKKLSDRERFHITEHRKVHGSKVCNVLDGADVRIFSEKGKQNISAAKLAFYKTEAGLTLRAKLSQVHMGKQISEETRLKLSSAHKGKRIGNLHPMFGRTGSGNPMFGKRHDAETITKMKRNRKRASDYNNPKSKMFDLKDNPLLSPQGDITYSILGLMQFCRKNNLSCSHLRKVLKGQFRSHKGWKLRDWKPNKK